MAKKIKILFAIGNLDVGGAEKLVLNQIRNIDKDRFEPHLCTLFPYGQNTYIEALEKLAGTPYHKFEFKGPWDIRSWLSARKLLKKEKYDIICCHLFESNFVMRLLNLFTGRKPVFIFEHNVYFKKEKWKILADKFFALKTERIFVDSNAILDFTADQEKISKEKFAILPYPIELSDSKEFDIDKIKEELGLPRESFVVGSVGRFVEQKGQTYLIQAASRILEKAKRQDIYFLLVGYGKMELDLRTLADDLKLNDRLLISPARDIRETLPVLDIFVISSLWEGQPIAMLEAMAASVPVVATSVGGIPEILEDGKDGLLAKPKDPDSLADKIMSLIQDDGLRKSVGASARGKVERYSMPVYIRKLEQYFVEAYESKNGH